MRNKNLKENTAASCGMYVRRVTETVCNVAARIVKFYCGLFSHSLSALKFQPNFPLDKRERENASCSDSADKSKINS